MANPLIVDLDGTLIRSDLTHEMLVLCARWKPHLFLFVVFRLLVSRVEGKQWLVELVGHKIDPEFLPYEPEVLDLVKTYRAKGAEVGLVSGSEHTMVERIARHLDIFDFYQGSDAQTQNLVSSTKAKFLQNRYSEGFHYAGNSNQDIAVWKVSNKGFGFRAPSLAYNTPLPDKEGLGVEKVTEKPSRLRALRKAMRLHQWTKNVLMFIVPGLVIETLTPVDGLKLLAAFVLFGMLASGTYILNDLFDIPDDRAHRTKKNRPLASADLSIPLAVVTLTVLIGVALIGSYFINSVFLMFMVTYGITTVAYSFRLKRLPILDVLILAWLFSLRVWSGAVVIENQPTQWLMIFIGFLFLSLALAKRYTETAKIAQQGQIPGRGYQSKDAPALLAFGAASAYTSVLSFAIYGLLADDRAIQNPVVLALLGVFVVGWFMRIWLVAARGELNDDPVLFAIKDPTSLLIMACAGILVVGEKLLPSGLSWF